MSADARPAVVALGLPGRCTVPWLAWSAPRPKAPKGNNYSGVCQHCSLRKVQRPCGLCWPCFYTPGVRELYPPTSKYGRPGPRPTGTAADRCRRGRRRPPRAPRRRWPSWKNAPG